MSISLDAAALASRRLAHRRRARAREREAAPMMHTYNEVDRCGPMLQLLSLAVQVALLACSLESSQSCGINNRRGEAIDHDAHPGVASVVRDQDHGVGVRVRFAALASRREMAAASSGATQAAWCR
jgi:hypothetical protein